MQTTDLKHGDLVHIGISLNAVRFIFCCVIQEEMSIVLEVIVPVIVRKKVHMTTCLILKVYWYRTVWISRPNSVSFCLWDWMKGEVDKRNVDKPEELLSRNMDCAASITKREDQLRRTTHDLRTRVAKCTEVDGGIFQNLLWNVTNL